MSEKLTGSRLNEGKLRYDLLHPVAQEGLVRVLTKGSQKYAERNWEKGMKWTTVLASLKRHIAAIEKGEDYDKESGELHADHVQCNAHFLSAYYKICPQGDDRRHSYLMTNKIGLDIDEVICDFTAGWAKAHGADPRPKYWNYDRNMKARFEEMKKKGELEKFYMSLEPKVNPSEIPFEPACYVTSRPVDTKLTEQWLDEHGFPAAKVVTVPFGTSKAAALKEAGVDIFVDDKYETFVELNKEGICCYLYDCPHNEVYEVGHKRIKSLKDLI